MHRLLMGLTWVLALLLIHVGIVLVGVVVVLPLIMLLFVFISFILNFNPPAGILLLDVGNGFLDLRFWSLEGDETIAEFIKMPLCVSFFKTMK